MRLPSDSALETVAAALDAGIKVFDTARAYEENEALLAHALHGVGGARIVTKGGMGTAWIPDGRAKAIRADCEASLEALGGLPIDLYLIHTPDPRTPWRTSVRALARLVEEGLVRRVGVANVNRRQLDEALEFAPIAAVQVALAWLLALSPVVVPIPGARRPETARSAAHAATLVVDAAELGGRRPATVARPRTDAEVVVVMGVPGAGKT